MTTDHDDSRPPLDDAQIEAFIADRDNARSPWPRGAQGTCGCATPSSFTPPSPTAEANRRSWLSRPCCRPDRSSPTAPAPMEQAIRRALDRA
jgi:hypothetical protein